MAIQLGDAVVNIKGDAAQLDKSIQSVGDKMKKVGKMATVAGGIITAAVGGMVKSYANAGDQVDKMSKRTGIGTEALSEFKHAAELSGTSLEAVEKGAKRMAKTIEDAKDGLSTAVRAFDKLGIEIAEFEGMNPEQAFNRLSMAIAEVEDPMQRAAIAQDVFGRAGTQLLPMLSSGAEGLAAMRKEAHELGLVFDEQAAADAAEFNDNLLRLKGSLKGAAFAIAKQLMPAINDMIVRVKEVVLGVVNWIKEHPRLTAGIAKTTAALGALLLIIGPLLIVLPGLIMGIGLLSGGLAGAGGVASVAGAATVATGAVGGFAAALGMVGLAGVVVGVTLLALRELHRAILAAGEAAEQKAESEKRLADQEEQLKRQSIALAADEIHQKTGFSARAVALIHEEIQTKTGAAVDMEKLTNRIVELQQEGLRGSQLVARLKKEAIEGTADIWVSSMYRMEATTREAQGGIQASIQETIGWLGELQRQATEMAINSWWPTAMRRMASSADIGARSVNRSFGRIIKRLLDIRRRHLGMIGQAPLSGAPAGVPGVPPPPIAEGAMRGLAGGGAGGAGGGNTYNIRNVFQDNVFNVRSQEDIEEIGRQLGSQFATVLGQRGLNLGLGTM